MLSRLRELEKAAQERKARDEEMRKLVGQRQVLWNEAKLRLLGAMRMNSNFNVEGARRTLLSNHLKEALTPFLPPSFRSREWHQVFSTEAHGTLTSAYQLWASKHLKAPGPGVLLVMDSGRNIFGAFCPFGWEIQPRLHYYGNGECFLFRSMPELEVYRATYANRHYVLAAHDSIALGGGGAFGLWLDGDFTQGASHPCTTFGNPDPIASSELFDVLSVEMWSLSREKAPNMPHTATQTLAH